MTDINLGSPITRSNKDEFISYLGSCLMFYTTHLSPNEQSELIPDIAGILKEALHPEEIKDLIRNFYPGCEIVISTKISERR